MRAGGARPRSKSPKRRGASKPAKATTRASKASTPLKRRGASKQANKAINQVRRLKIGTAKALRLGVPKTKAAQAKELAAHDLRVPLKIRAVRSALHDLHQRDFLAHRRNGMLAWVPEPLLSVARRDIDAWCGNHDRRDKYTAYTPKTPEEFAALPAKLAVKRGIAQLHASLVQRRGQRQGAPFFELALVHPSEWVTVPALEAIGIAKRDIYAAQPFAYAKCCGRGINVFDCYLRDLPWRLHALGVGPIGSVWADFDNQWTDVIASELLGFWAAAALRNCFADRFVFSLTLAGSHQMQHAPCNAETVEFVVGLAARYGYTVIDSRDRPYKNDKGSHQMYYWGFLLERTLQPQPQPQALLVSAKPTRRAQPKHDVTLAPDAVGLTVEDRDVLLRGLFAALPVHRIGDDLYLVSADIARLSDASVAKLRTLADVSLPKDLRYRYGRGSLTPRGLRLSVVRGLLEVLAIGEPSDYRGPHKAHFRKYHLATASLANLERVQALGGRVVAVK